MTRTPPTIEELRGLGLRLLDSAKQQLTDTKNLVPTIILGDPMDGGGDLVVGVFGNLMNSDEAKNALVKKVRGLIAEHGYMHSVSLLDTYILNIEPADERKRRALHVLHGLMGLSLKEISEAGLGKLEERAMVVVEAVGKSMMLWFSYERDDQGSVVKVGEVHEDARGLGGGRFKFFDSEETDVDGVGEKR